MEEFTFGDETFLNTNQKPTKPTSEKRKIASRENGKKGGRPRITEKLKKETNFIIPEINRQAYAELARTASNLNQIASHLNRHKDLTPTAKFAEKIYEELKIFRLTLLNLEASK
jgi:hypothetical protein